MGIFGKGIYGIYVDRELVYVGMTTGSFFGRFCEHKDNILNKDKQEQRDLYDFLREAIAADKMVAMEPIINLSDLTLSFGQRLTARDLCDMEMTVIALYKPRFNKQGLLTNYQYCKDDDREIFTCMRYTQGWTKLLMESHWRLDFTKKVNEAKEDALYD